MAGSAEMVAFCLAAEAETAGGDAAAVPADDTLVVPTTASRPTDRAVRAPVIRRGERGVDTW
jgi:hypothetical protein